MEASMALTAGGLPPPWWTWSRRWREAWIALAAGESRGVLPPVRCITNGRAGLGSSAAAGFGLGFGAVLMALEVLLTGGGRAHRRGQHRQEGEGGEEKTHGDQNGRDLAAE